MSVVQIAAAAGVSIATVSRVLNNSRRVNPKLIEQVQRALVTLNVDPSQIRRRSAHRRGAETRAGTIAIVALGQRYRGWFEIPVIAAVVAEITRAAIDRDLRTLIAEMHDPAELSPVISGSVDGALVFIDSTLPPDAPMLLARQLPTVRVMGGQFAPSEIDHVGVDNNGVGYLACQTLLAHGCRNLAYLTMRPSWDLSKLRGHGFSAAALAAGIRPRAFVAGEKSEFDCVYGGNLVAAPDLRDVVTQVADAVRARRDDEPFGLFVSRDEETVLVYRILAELGIRPGHDLTIVSCDNEPVRLSGLEPRPMSIDLNVTEIARQAVARLVDRMARRDDPPVRLLVNPLLGKPNDRNGVALALPAARGALG